MNKIIVLFMFTLSFFIKQEKFTEWTCESGDRKYVVQIYDKKINIKINEYEYSYVLENLNNKKVFKDNDEYYYFTIENNKLRFSYYKKKYRRDVVEMITLDFLKK